MIYITCTCAGHAFYQLLLLFLPLLSFPPAAPCLYLFVRSVLFTSNSETPPPHDSKDSQRFLAWYVLCVEHTYILQCVFTCTIAATHAVVLFTADDSVSIVPVKRIIKENIQVQQPCSVRWTDDTVYEGTLQAIGS